VQLDAAGLQFGRRRCTQHLVEPAQRQPIAVVERHLRAQPGQHAGEFDRDVARADDRYFIRQRRQVEQIVARGAMLEPRDVVAHRRSAGGDEHVLCGDQALATGLLDQHAVRPVEARPAFDQFDAAAGQHLAIDAFQPGGLVGLGALPACHLESGVVLERPAIAAGFTKESLNCAAYINSFFGTQPRMTQVPPTRPPSTTATRLRAAPRGATRRHRRSRLRSPADQSRRRKVHCSWLHCRTAAQCSACHGQSSRR
jgi:hypothetical protein